MASTALNYLNSFTVSNQGIEDLRELIRLNTLEAGSLNEVVDVIFGVRQGKRLGGIGDFGTVGESKPLCNPTWNATNLATEEKVWDLGAVGIYERLCGDDFLNTIVQFSMKRGTYKADLTGDDLMTLIVEPGLTKAWNDAMWRVAWFADTDAQTVGTGDGTLTNNADSAPKFFNMTDGFFKRLFEIAPTGSAQHIPIPANAGTTYAEQDEQMFDGTTDLVSIVDRMIYTNRRLRMSGDRFILCTQSFADALAAQIKRDNRGSDLAWNAQFDGLVSATIYNGITFIALPIWDDMIRKYYDDGTKWNYPHRAVYTSKSNLKFGIESDSAMATLDVWFSKDDQDVKVLARDEVGTLIWEDDLVTFAY